MPSTPTSPSGETIGRYRVESELGAGGIGVVYRAYDPLLERPVAIKLVCPGDGRSFDDRRLMEEARSASRLNHPNVCTIHEIGESEGRAFIVMELIEGQSLRHLITTGGLPLEAATGYGIQIASALAHAHERGVVHRDLKPDNVIVTPDGRAKVLDFGLALRLPSGSVSQSASTDSLADPPAGTLAYMAPEVLRGRPADPPSDVWAFGVLLYEMLRGQRPFAGATAFELTAAVLGELAPALPASVPTALRILVDRCLAKAPEQRYQRAAEIQVALETLRAGLSWARVPVGSVVPPTPAIPRVLVLPFADLAPGGPGGDFLADALTDEIITDLSKLGAMRVISRTSSMRLKDSSDDIAAIGDRLKVRYVLEGSVQRSDPQVRVSVKLIDVQTDSPVWAERFTGTAQDVLAMQESIARGVVAALQLRLSAQEAHRLGERPIVDARAYETYLRVKQEIYRYSAEGLERALALLRGSMSLVGENVLLLAAMGEVYWQYLNAGLSSDLDYLDQARACATKILALDPESPHGHRLLGLIQLHNGDLEHAFRRLKQVLAREPNDPDTLMWTSVSMSLAGYPQVAAPWTARLLEIDPLTPLYRVLPALLALMEGRFDKAAAVLHDTYSRTLDNPGVRVLYGQILAMKGSRDEACTVFDALRADMPESPFSQMGLFYRHALAGNRERALGALTEEAKQAFRGDCQFSWMVAQCYALAGEPAEGLAWLRRAVERGFLNHPLLAEKDPLLAGLRGEPGFDALADETERRWRALEV